MDSGKVYCIVGGKLAKVPTAYVKKVLKKEELVAYAARLQKTIDVAYKTPGQQTTIDVAGIELGQVVRKIIRLNRQIPPVVQFV